MGLFASLGIHARDRLVTLGPDDPGQTPPHGRLARAWRISAIACAGGAFLAASAAADTLRVAYFHSGLGRDGPGLMLRALTVRPEAQSTAALDVMAAAGADILVLGDLDWDHGLAGLRALQAGLAERGRTYPYFAFPQPVSGIDSGFDLDGDGRLREPEDGLGYGRFTGDNGVAVLSMLPLGAPKLHHETLWAEHRSLTGLVPKGAETVLPLATSALWEVEVAGFTLLVFALTAPVFDGPEDRNGKRNQDQIAFLMTQAETLSRPLLTGRINLDPLDGDGFRDTAQALLTSPRLQDPMPRSAGGEAMPNPSGHQGDPGLDTVNWSDGPGALRVDYILPSRQVEISASGVLWPANGAPLSETGEEAGQNRLVWVDIAQP